MFTPSTLCSDAPGVAERVASAIRGPAQRVLRRAARALHAVPLLVEHGGA